MTEKAIQAIVIIGCCMSLLVQSGCMPMRDEAALDSDTPDCIAHKGNQQTPCNPLYCPMGEGRC